LILPPVRGNIGSFLLEYKHNEMQNIKKCENDGCLSEGAISEFSRGD
jgi:hypothetical protein